MSPNLVTVAQTVYVQCFCCGSLLLQKESTDRQRARTNKGHAFSAPLNKVTLLLMDSSGATNTRHYCGLVSLSEATININNA